MKLLVKETKRSPEEITKMLAVPPDPTLGDYAFPCFTLGKNPKQAAEQLQRKITLPKYLSKIVVAGPYLNFFLNKDFLADKVLIAVRQEKKKYGAGNLKKKMVVEFCGPNTNKPLHLGHLRNMALGDALVRILKFQGNKVHPVNIVNDRGIHICQSMLAYQKWGKGKVPDKKGDHFVGDYYVLFAQKSKDNEELQHKAQELLLKWEQGDKPTLALWKKMTKWVLDGFSQTYRRFGISFEKQYFESQYYEQAKDIVAEGIKQGVFITPSAEKPFQEGETVFTSGTVAPLQHSPSKMVLRNDGTSLYITQDLYLAQQRYDDFRFDQLIYVVASEQNTHFKQLFEILELLKRPFARKLYHLSYGLVHLPSGRMKSREGTVVDADDIMDEVAALAEKEVTARYPELSAAEKKKRAEAISLAAIKFFMLRTDAVRDMVFNPEESISFEGETGPYVQYTYARAGSILRKAGAVKGKINPALLAQPQERKLIIALLNFPELLSEVAANFKPHVLCRYLLDLAQAFNEFYHAYPVISDDKELMKARLALVEAVRQVLANGLELLGIIPLEVM